MQFLMTSLALAAGSLTTSHTQPANTTDTLSPPGMVLIEGGRTKIGTDFKDLVKLIEENSEALESAGGVLSEAPQHTVAVDDFFMMVSEVTNEQYRAYVMATNARPPLAFAEDLLNTARAAFVEEQGLLRRKAAEAGEPAPPRIVFDDAEWWDKNWKDTEWTMPEAVAKKPAVHIDHTQAKAYARWAGLRLPTEFEFERAVRGNTENDFPWGADWESGFAVTKEMRATSDALEVGSCDDGVSPDGLHDLAGNVWEWTDSKFLQYPGWKHKKFTVGKGSLKKTIDRMPKWSPDRRVMRGGCQQNGYILSRGSTRGGFDRDIRSQLVGFRCAASEKPGLDFALNAQGAIDNDVRGRDANGLVTYAPSQVIARDRWTYAEGTSEIPGYSVITSYDYVLFTPVESLLTNGLGDFRKGALIDELYHLGFLTVSKDLLEPALLTGTYMIAIRGAGKYASRKEVNGEAEPEVVEAGATEEEEPSQSVVQIDDFLEIDPLKDNFIFLDMSGTPVASMVADKIDYGSSSAGGGSATVIDRPLTIEVSANDPKKPEAMEEIEIMQQWLDISFFIKGRSRKGLKATLSVRFEEGLFDASWR
ncbi:MAG: sulfatase activating formylglycine-generating enzyme [Planctomycetota bacterium]|jgi:formylglycine-generating enzyme required for sulfatase activity